MNEDELEQLLALQIVLSAFLSFCGDATFQDIKARAVAANPRVVSRIDDILNHSRYVRGLAGPD